MIRRQVIGAGLILGILGGILIDVNRPMHTAEAALEQTEVAEKEIQIQVVIDWTPTRIEKEIDTKATEYGVSASLMKKLIQCESQGSTTIQSFHIRKDGTREQSFGLAQIHLPAHTDVTREEAIDPQFAIDFMAKNIAAGRASMWSCLKLI